jgi:hypothetical protein
MGTDLTVDGYRIQPLSQRTWDAFADLAERHNGVWGGCWCTWFHSYPDPPERKELGNREFKRRLVEQDRAHAALVFDADVAVAWAQYGPVAELPNIHHRKQWEQGVGQMPDYRITCLFVDRNYRRKGMAEVAVRGAGAHRGSGRWPGGVLSARSAAGQEDLGVVPLQRHPDDVRPARLQLRAAQGDGQLRDVQGRPRRLDGTPVNLTGLLASQNTGHVTTGAVSRPLERREHRGCRSHSVAGLRRRPYKACAGGLLG